MTVKDLEAEVRRYFPKFPGFSRTEGNVRLVVHIMTPRGSKPIHLDLVDWVVAHRTGRDDKTILHILTHIVVGRIRATYRANDIQTVQ